MSWQTYGLYLIPAFMSNGKNTYINIVDTAYNIVYTVHKGVVTVSGKASFNVRIDEDLKNDASMFFNSMGLSLTGAINLFIKQSLMQGELPFKLVGDMFYTERYQKELDRIHGDMRQGNKVDMSFDAWEREYDR
jgi:DNA-damage-inducible protein J